MVLKRVHKSTSVVEWDVSWHFPCLFLFVLEGRSHPRRIPSAFPPCPVHGWEFHVVGWTRPFLRGSYLVSFRCLCFGFVSIADPTKVGACSTFRSDVVASPSTTW